MPPDDNRTTVMLVDAEEIGLESDLHLELPESSSFDLSLIDHDSQECRIVTIGELRESYVDSNIVRIGSLRPDPWTLDPAQLDQQELEIEYSDGRSFSLPLGRISMEPGRRTTTYMKVDGISFAVDDTGNILFDRTNTPVLSVTRQDFHEQLRGMAEVRLEIATITFIFSQIIAGNSQLDGLTL